MLRDMRENAVSYLACVSIIAIGLLTYVSMANVRDILVEAKNTYYRDYRFADVFADVREFPASKLAALARVPGIAQLSHQPDELGPRHGVLPERRLIKHQHTWPGRQHRTDRQSTLFATR